MSSIERENEKFVWRPSTAAHFQRDKELLLRYREVHAWRLFVGMSLLYIMYVCFDLLRLSYSDPTFYLQTADILYSGQWNNFEYISWVCFS